MNKVYVSLIFAVGVINLLPLLGIVGGTRLSGAYAVDIAGSDLEILLRHRALLFGIIGGFVLFSIFAPVYQGAALVMAGLSMLGFILICLQVGDHNAALQRIMLVDVAGLVCLAAALAIKLVVLR